jgi:phosphoglycerol transferase MdoB-like AlkP superfamily enzyme
MKDQTGMLKDLIGFSFSEYNWTMLQKTPCFIRFPGMKETGINSTICGEIDLLPTIANLMGLKAPYALGKDIFNTQKGYAVLRNSSVITDDFTYVSGDGKVYGKEGQLLDISKYEKIIEQYQHELKISDIILQKNALAKYKK